MEFKTEGKGENSKILQRTREYFEDETPVEKAENEAEDSKVHWANHESCEDKKEEIPHRKSEYFESETSELKPEKNACSSECPFCNMKTEDFKAHLRSSERCGALHQMGELEAKIKSQEKQLEATKEELRMLREKYEKELLKSSNSPPSQETPSSEGEHDVLEDEAEAAKEVFQGAVGETEEESAGSTELNKETKGERGSQ